MVEKEAPTTVRNLQPWTYACLGSTNVYLNLHHSQAILPTSRHKTLLDSRPGIWMVHCTTSSCHWKWNLRCPSQLPLPIKPPTSATKRYLPHLLRPTTWPPHDPHSIRHIQTEIHGNHYQRRKVRLHWLPFPRLPRPLGRFPSPQPTSPIVSTTIHEWTRILIPTSQCWHGH